MKDMREPVSMLYSTNTATKEPAKAPDSEELEMLDDSELMESLERAKQDRAIGRYKKWEDVKRFNSSSTSN